MFVLVTSGGSVEPIDDVRVLTNRSTGRLGAQLADALLERGHRVTLLHGVDAVLPAGGASLVAYQTGRDLGDLLERHVPGAAAVFHAAAVADYVPQRREGKLSSEASTMTLQLTRAPKLVDGLRSLAPDALLVGFKLTSGATEAQRVEAAQALRRRARLDLVLANDTAVLGEEDHSALLVGPEGIRERFAGKAAIAAGLADLTGAGTAADRGELLS